MFSLFSSSSGFLNILLKIATQITTAVYPDNSYLGSETRAHTNEGMIAFYDFENGNVNDKSGNGNNGIENGSILTTTGARNGSYCINSQGSNQNLLDCGSISITPDDGLAISFWLKSQYHGGKHSYVFSLNSSIYLQIENGRNYKLRLQPGSTIVDYGPIDTWHHLTVQFLHTNGGVRIYSDGVQIQASNVTSITSTLTAKFLWGDKSSKTNYRGDVDDIRMHNTVLSLEDVELLSKNKYDDSMLMLQMSFQIDARDTLDIYNGTLSGNAVDNTRYKYGSRSLTSDGNNQSSRYVSMPEIPLNTKAGMTISYWFYSEAGESSGDNLVWEAEKDTNSNGRTYVFQYKEDRSKFRFTDNTNCIFNASIGSWHQLVITVTASDVINIWLDKSKVINNITQNHAMPNNKIDAGWKIGANISNTSNLCSYDGSIAEFKLWNRVLSASEVSNII